MYRSSPDVLLLVIQSVHNSNSWCTAVHQVCCYWLYSQCMAVTADAPHFTRCLFTAMRMIISELQKAGCNSCSGIFVTSKRLCKNSWKAFHIVRCFSVSRSSWLIKTSVLISAGQQTVFTGGSTDCKWKNMIHASVSEQKGQNDRKQYPGHNFSVICFVLLHSPYSFH